MSLFGYKISMFKKTIYIKDGSVQCKCLFACAYVGRAMCKQQKILFAALCAVVFAVMTKCTQLLQQLSISQIATRNPDDYLFFAKRKQLLKQRANELVDGESNGREII